MQASLAEHLMACQEKGVHPDKGGFPMGAVAKPLPVVLYGFYGFTYLSPVCAFTASMNAGA